MAQPDPSHSVPQDLMPHVHLVSSYRYPTMPRLDLNEVAKWLMTAPQIARDRAPFFWTYLDKPADGTILLTWQPLQRLATNFATDGFVWAPPEQVYKHDLGNGLMLEVCMLKAGYIPGEQYAMHARRRFRLVPAPGHPNPPPIDMSLYIVHYGPSDQNDRIPVTMIPYDERVNAIMQQRQFLLRGGQIRRKEFMLSDRVNWPSLPELTRQQMGPQMTPRGVPQQMAYPTQPSAGPPAKRARHASQTQQAAAGTAANAPPGPPALDAAFDDDEDVSRGDMFDHLTPREISLSRYQQNHEWMEEILSSAYRIGQIQPSDLNLGLKGELASLTEGIFTAQGVDVFTQAPDKPYVGRLDAGLADEFRMRVEKHIESTQAEMKKMEEEHAELLASFKTSSALKVKEKQIRSIPDPPAPEIFKTDDDMDTGDDEGNSGAGAGAGAATSSKAAFDDILKDVEAVIGRRVEVVPHVRRVQDGGYQAPAPKAPTPAPIMTTQMSRLPSHAGSQNSGLGIGDSDMEMGGTAAGLLDQMHSRFSSVSTPANNFPTPQAQASAAHSNAPTPSNFNNVASPAVSGAAASSNVQRAAQAAAPDAAASSAMSGDVEMTGTDTDIAVPEQTDGTTSGEGDWVVVPNDGPGPGAAAGAGVSADQDAAKISTGSNGASSHTTGAGGAGLTEDDAQKRMAAKPISAAATPAVTDGGSTGFGGSDQHDLSSLGDMNTAGDAMASYDDSAGGLGDGLDLPMGMDEESAFGDAFHGVGVGSGETPGGTPGGEIE